MNRIRSIIGSALFALALAVSTPGLCAEASAPAGGLAGCKPTQPIFFPQIAIRLKQQGRVYVAFTVGDDGRVETYKVLSAEPGDRFTATALHSLATLQCAVAEARAHGPGPTRVFRMNFVFELAGIGGIQPFDPTAQTVTITGTPIAKTH